MIGYRLLEASQNFLWNINCLEINPLWRVCKKLGVVIDGYKNDFAAMEIWAYPNPKAALSHPWLAARSLKRGTRKKIGDVGETSERTQTMAGWTSQICDRRS